MSKSTRRMTVFMTFLLVGVLLFTPFFRMVSRADGLAQGYLLLERMKVSTATDMTVLFTPGTSFTGTEPISLRIIFPEATAGTWCTTNEGPLTIAGAEVGDSPIDQGAWTIDAALPAVTTLVATCYQGTGGGTDYIEVTDIGPLTGETSYGFTLEHNSNFITGANSGSNVISYQLIEDNKVESITFPVALLADDQVSVTATVSASNTLTCTVGASAVSMGSLFLGGAYVTANHSLATNSSGTGFYWAVSGVGNGTTAGLYKSTSTIYLLSSEHGTGRIDLVGGEGFGLVISSHGGATPTTNYTPSGGSFGEITTDPILILQHNTLGNLTHTVTLGARAGASAQAGDYAETLTYICGAYFGTP